ncbi:uncharacterized protein TRIVIDRAFT_155305 [Trichoderma virens Gv29-8]|uniref:FAS1 domain-containing protein n=1 Tax=Hypocrea virens (strain Gv29-8 / FGSC 10586) TaxID=413071 RepID=G9MZB5_HYPVG|nr:uncharacterized protein TRIVIDRAFT_155305 [Trichoderma virens Gv29-8]EHK19972.1 hypothetical protein TRIVIDRAFT_155305 [Trichoderma virens Gv29-8]
MASGALAQSPQSLFSTLQANGFTEFAQRLPTIELTSAEAGLVVYAPNNNAFIISGNATVARATIGPPPAALNLARFRGGGSFQYNSRALATRMAKRATSRGSVYETLYHDDFVLLGSGHNQSLVERNVPSASLPFVFSGLGKSAQVVGSDIPFDKGVIRPIDAVLTLPRSLSSTLQAIGGVKLAAALKQTNLTATLEGAESITVLAPSNEVFSLSSTLTQTQIVQVLKEHIIVAPSFPAYSPWLEDGQIFRTLGGTNVSVVIKDDVAYLNGARILTGDSIIQNGVVHTIDKVFQPP